MAPRIIYDSEHLRVMHRPGASAFALVTFSHATQFVNGRWFWGDSIAAKADLEAIGIVATRANWFPAAAMERAAPAIRAALRSRKQIVGFGTSMGGYGALKYGRLLGMTHALAFVPQWSIDPADVGAWDQRFTRHFDPAVHDRVAIMPDEAAATAAILYDPFMRLDQLNFARILAANPHCAGIKSFFTGHAAIGTFAGTEKIMVLLRRVLAGDFPAMQFLAAQARRDPGSAVRPLTLAQMMVTRDTGRAARIAAVHADKFNARQIASLHNDIACALSAKGAFAKALEHSVIATEIFVERDFLIRRSMIEHSLGKHQEALVIARNVVARWPQNPGGRLHLSALLAAAGDQEGALAQAGDALQLAPGSVVALERLASLTTGARHLAYVERLGTVRPGFRSELMLGAALESVGRLDEAACAYASAAREKPGQALPWQKTAGMLIRARRWSAAVQAGRRAVAVEPENAACHVALAAALRGGGWRRDALRAAGAALRLAPAHPAALRLKRELQGAIAGRPPAQVSPL